MSGWALPVYRLCDNARQRFVWLFLSHAKGRFAGLGGTGMKGVMDAHLSADARTGYESPFTKIVIDPTAKFVWYMRSATPYPDLTVARHEVSTAALLVPHEARADLRLILDIRLARGRNDPRFEAINNKFREQMFAGYLRTAIVVRTVIGEMQVQRHARETKGPANTFRSIGAAFDYFNGK